MAICASRKCRSFGVILASWGIAFIEYCMAVPANRWGSAVYTTAQLKTIQEIITLLVFAGFSIAYLKEPMIWNYAIGFVLVAAGAYFIFRGRFNRTAPVEPRFGSERNRGQKGRVCALRYPACASPNGPNRHRNLSICS